MYVRLSILICNSLKKTPTLWKQLVICWVSPAVVNLPQPMKSQFDDLITPAEFKAEQETRNI